MESEFLSLKEAASVFSVNEVTLRRAIRQGLIIAIRLGRGPKSPYRISKKSIQDIHERILFLHEILSRKKD